MIRFRRVARAAACVAAATGALLAARPAAAQDGGTVVMCNTLPNPVYVSGSTAFEVTVQGFALKMSALGTPITVVYNLPPGGSCDGVAAITSNTDLTGTAHYYTAAGTAGQITCTLAAGTKADVGISDVFYESCGTGAKPSTLGDYVGPAQAMVFIVPEANTSVTSITYEEAQLVYGCGMAGMISPFLADGGIFRRNPTSGTQITVAKNIGVAPGAIMGNETTGSGAMATAVTGYSMPQASIGFISNDAYETRRATLNALAFKAKEQTMAFFADSNSGAADRRNVRDGHYLIWGYEHMFAPGDASGPTKAVAKDFVGYITGTKADATIDFVNIEGKAGTIPLCAMKVKRATDGGDLSVNDRSTSGTCDCAFESALTSSTPAGCPTCTVPGDCTGGKTCQHGFCE